MMLAPSDAPVQPRLHIEPCELADANAFVDSLHRHNKKVTGHRWSCQVKDGDGYTRGVAIVGRPVSRGVNQRQVVEVLRVCTDGTPNACSALYGATCRQHRAIGYRYAITYTLADEPGTSLIAAGWKPVELLTARPKGWDVPSRRRDSDVTPNGAKVRWECKCGPSPRIQGAMMTPEYASNLRRCDTAYRANELCCAWLNEDTLCDRPLGHLRGDLPHRGHDPSGSGRWIEYDDNGRELRRGGPWQGDGGDDD